MADRVKDIRIKRDESEALHGMYYALLNRKCKNKLNTKEQKKKERIEKGKLKKKLRREKMRKQKRKMKEKVAG